jgi:hypothetical protein
MVCLGVLELLSAQYTKARSTIATATTRKHYVTQSAQLTVLQHHHYCYKKK